MSDGAAATPTIPSSSGRVQVVLATTVLLSFISFWRAAAIVLSDLGSTAYYVGGISEQAVGVARNGGTTSVELTAIVERISRAGGTPLVVAERTRPLGGIHLKDIVKGGIRERF